MNEALARDIMKVMEWILEGKLTRKQGEEVLIELLTSAKNPIN